MKSMRVRASHWKLVLPVALACLVAVAMTAAATQAGTNTKGPKFTEAAAFDISKPLRELVKGQKPAAKSLPPATGKDTDSELSAEVAASARFAPGASTNAATTHQAANALGAAAAIPGTTANFEGLSNQDNFNVFGFRVNPPDPVGDVGPNHYVEMINLVYGVYSKTGTLLLGPIDTGTLWAGFADRRLHRSLRRPDRGLRPARRSLAPEPVHDARPGRSDDLSVLQLRRGLADRRPDRRRTTATRSRPATAQLPRLPEVRGLEGLVRHDDPRVRASTVEYGIGVYGLERNKMIDGQPEGTGRAASSSTATTRRPFRSSVTVCCRRTSTASRSRRLTLRRPIVGTQDDGGGIRGDVRRAQHLGLRRQVALDAGGIARS